MKCVEEVGLLKMDFLGLRTLTVVHEAVRLIRETTGISIDIDAIETSDEKAYALLRSGFTTGVFQLESSGMRDLAKRIGLQSMEEMSALVALFRPGPMQFIDTYMRTSSTRSRQVRPPAAGADPEGDLRHPGVPGAGDADGAGTGRVLARAGGHHAPRHGQEEGRPDGRTARHLREGCKRTNNIAEKLASELFDKIETFAGYGFNKSHSVAYAFRGLPDGLPQGELSRGVHVRTAHE
jgi:DNA polymerase-3 subunit alpha